MPQLSFLNNHPQMFPHEMSFSSNTISFVPFNVGDSISLKTMQIPFGFGDGDTDGQHTQSFSLRVGLYSLNGSTLSMANSISGFRTFTINVNQTLIWMSMTDVSATQNITPGTWYMGLLVRFSAGTSDSSGNFQGATRINPMNAFPAGFIGGRMTESSSALPASYATSNLDITGTDAMNVPYILLTS